MPPRGITTSTTLLATIKQFTPLILTAMRHKHMNSAELSRQTGITKSKLSRGLSGKSPLDITSIHSICQCVGIDTQRALLAIGVLGDWNRYYDPDISVVSDLIRQLPTTLAEARDGCDRVAVSDQGIKIIAKLVGDVIADNDRKVAERRDAFAVERETRRTG